MNTKKLGDRGLGRAISHYTETGETVCLPLTDNQDYDLVVDRDGRLEKVQVKYSTYKRNGWFTVDVAIRGGTKGGVTKKGEDVIFDFLFVSTDEGNWESPRSAFKAMVTLNSSKDIYKV